SAYNVTLQKHPVQEGDSGWEEEEEDERKRTPARSVYCSISRRNGIEVSAIDKEEIELFEIYHNGVCLLSSPEEKDFITVLFSISGNLEIRLITSDYAFIGYIGM
ncbi:MAG: hypothetical protein K2J03_00955, partial [Muribaculaceae bacterium]|nr:hypothetical protein [Muribaculaceae bacterium]